MNVMGLVLRVEEVRLSCNNGSSSPSYLNIAKDAADAAAAQLAKARQELQATEDLLRQSQPTFPEVVQELARSPDDSKRHADLMAALLPSGLLVERTLDTDYEVVWDVWVRGIRRRSDGTLVLPDCPPRQHHKPQRSQHHKMPAKAPPRNLRLACEGTKGCADEAGRSTAQ